jgi:hypothetical protein
VEASLRKLPAFLRELRATTRSLEYFSDAGTPVVEALGKAAPSFTQATRALTPFSAASTVSLKALGATGEVAGPKIRAADPLVRKIRKLARTGANPTTELAAFLTSATKTGGFDSLADLIYNGAATVNEFDRYGHFGRNILALSDCIDYWVATPRSGCVANFNGPNARSTGTASDALELFYEMQEELAEESGGTAVGPGSAPLAPARPVPAPQAPSLGESEQLGTAAQPAAPQRALLDYLLGP